MKNTENNSDLKDLSDRYSLLKHELSALARRWNLPECTLLAVTKQQPIEKINMLIEAGHRFFAENKVQEAILHWQEIKQQRAGMELHLIGALQSNKAKEAVMLFDVIETVDRIKIADAIAKEAQKQGKRQRIMIQVNIGHEPQKAGVAVEALPELVAHCQQLEGLTLEGLMCIPPVGANPVPYFNEMKALQQHYALRHLSMGMSGDYREAIACGATHIRIGTALLGERAN